MARSRPAQYVGFITYENRRLTQNARLSPLLVKSRCYASNHGSGRTPAYNATPMRCPDTLAAFVVFFVFGMVVAIWPKPMRDAQFFLWAKIRIFSLDQFLQSQRCVWFVRLQGVLFMGVGLFLLLWHLRHCP